MIVSGLALCIDSNYSYRGEASVENAVWLVNKHLKLCDWGEGDAVAYLQGAGDLHMISGVTLSILSFLLAKSQSLQELLRELNDSTDNNYESGFIQRHLLQLEVLGLIARAER